jgi:bifunctional DNA-binding transcriptional regulator/antitoxin component of YhaV-PrlF toxin-antitoxin module
MAALGKVQAGGEVILPTDIRRDVGIRPGDTVLFRQTGPSTVELEVLPRLSLAEIIERYRVDQPYDDAAIREEWQEAAARELLGSRDE